MMGFQISITPCSLYSGVFRNFFKVRLYVRSLLNPKSRQQNFLFLLVDCIASNAWCIRYRAKNSEVGIPKLA